MFRTGASYFRLVQPNCSVNKLGRGSGGMLPQEVFKIRHSEIASEAMVNPKWQNTTRITPPVVSVAREPFEPSCQKDHHARCACLRAHLALK